MRATVGQANYVHDKGDVAGMLSMRSLDHLAGRPHLSTNPQPSSALISVNWLIRGFPPDQHVYINKAASTRSHTNQEGDNYTQLPCCRYWSSGFNHPWISATALPALFLLHRSSSIWERDDGLCELQTLSDNHYSMLSGQHSKN